jgi:RNA polymerase primary sigma factor
LQSSYKSIIRRHIEASESIPTEEQIASEIGVSLARLRTAIKVTESLLSVDEPVYTGGNAAFKGSGAGGDLSGENSLLISDRLESSEIAPEDYVETGFLRQTLENAMAAELSPYERDILRLRLGLDDGQTRTVKQVVEECGGDISVAEVRSAERRAFKKLRSPNAVHAHNLVAYLEMADIDVETFEQGW